MWEILPVIVFGWPAIIASLACSFAGVARRKPLLVVAGAVLAAPTAWYLMMASRYWYVGPIFPLLALAAAYAVKQRRRGLALLLLLPFAGYAVWLAVSVIRQ